MKQGYHVRLTRTRNRMSLPALALIALFFAGFAVEANAQGMTCTVADGRRTCQVPAHFPGEGLTLNEFIDGDTTATGARVDANTTYVLERGEVYLLTGTVTATDFPLNLVAEEGAGERPRLIPAVGSGGTASRAISVGQDLTLRGVYVTNQDELGALQDRIITVRGPGSRIVIEDTHLDRANQAAIRVDAADASFYIRNSIISNIGTPSSPNNGRGIDDRGNAIDTIVVENTTFYNLTSRALRDAGGLTNYAKFDHNTFFNLGQFGVSFGPVIRAIFTNNVMVNAGFYGNNAETAFQVIQVDSLTENQQDQQVTIRNNNFYIDPAVLATYPGTVTAVPLFDAGAQAWIDANGTASSNISEALAFDAAPVAPTQVLTTYFADPGGEQEDWNTGLPEDADLLDPSVDLMPFDFTYPNTATSFTASTAGQPLGDLTWFGLQITPTSNGREKDLPSGLALRGNHPNPFRSSTAIVFDLKSAAEVSVSVYDVLGRRVLQLAPRQLQAGSGRSIELNAASLAAGAYLYTVQVATASGSEVRSGRLVVLK